MASSSDPISQLTSRGRATIIMTRQPNSIDPNSRNPKPGITKISNPVTGLKPQQSQLFRPGGWTTK